MDIDRAMRPTLGDRLARISWGDLLLGLGVGAVGGYAYRWATTRVTPPSSGALPAGNVSALSVERYVPDEQGSMADPLRDLTPTFIDTTPVSAENVSQEGVQSVHRQAPLLVGRDRQ